MFLQKKLLDDYKRQQMINHNKSEINIKSIFICTVNRIYGYLLQKILHTYK